MNSSQRYALRVLRFRNSRFLRKIKYHIVAIVLVIGLMVGDIFPAYASSAYDDLVQPASILEAGYSWNTAPAFQTLTAVTYMQYFTQYCPLVAVNSYKDALERGSNFAIIQNNSLYASERNPMFIWQNNTTGDFAGTFQSDETSETSIKRLSFSAIGGATYMSYSLSYSGSYGWSCFGFTGTSSFSIASETRNKDNNSTLHITQPFVSTFSNFSVPPGYAGTQIPDGSNDEDDDGMSLLQELQQGTSDDNSDSDSDGIDDYKESKWFEGRDDVYCKTSVTPYVCAYPDPIKKDIYVEIDWMKNNATNTLYKPTSTQLGLVVGMFNDEGIKLHFDTGDYGGGNELVDYDAALRYDSVASIPDFNDYKVGGDGINRNFAANRQGIWRYMIYGNQYSNAGGTSVSSGWAELLGDDLFVAGGSLDSFPGKADNDRAIAGTIAHELGHGLCLSDSRVYFEQSADCAFEGIDNNSGNPPTNNPDDYFNLESYESVMNYRYQATNIDDLGSVEYSHGPTSSDNHDDWSAVKEHVGGFNGSHTPYVEFGARGFNMLNDQPVSADGLIIVESR